MNHYLIPTLFAICFISLIPFSYAESIVNDRLKIDSSTIVTDGGTTFGLEIDDLFGYYIEPIGDLDGDGVVDLAVSKYQDDNSEGTAPFNGGDDDYGSILILFMNSDGTVKSTNEILHWDYTNVVDQTNGLKTCITNVNTQVDPDISGFESMAYLGNLINGNPTLAIGAPWDNHDNSRSAGSDVINSGAIYLVELINTGKVNSCVKIVDNDGSLFNPSSVGTGDDGAALGYSLAATDLDGDGTNELLTSISNTSGENDLWAFYLDSAGVITTATEYTSVSLGINSYWDTMRTINESNKIAIGKEGTGIYIVNFVGNTGVLSSINTITAASVGSTDIAFGSGITPIGDLDRDGVVDIVVGSPFSHDNGLGGGDFEGVFYILFMNSDDTLRNYQKISNTSEKARTGSTFLESRDFMGNSIAFWHTLEGEIVIAVGAHADGTGSNDYGAIYLFYLNALYPGEVTDTPKKKSSSCNDCTPPTLGLNKNHKRVVDNGFSFNGNYTNVEFWHTEFPLISTEIGQNNTITFKIYENHGINEIDHAHIGLGIPEIGKGLHSAEVDMEFDLLAGKIVDVTIKDKQSLVQNVTSSTGIVPCQAGDTTNKCLEITAHYTYRESPISSIVLINVVDDHHNSQNHYINEGVIVNGDSLNAADTLLVSGTHYTQLDKWKQLWEDDEGIQYIKDKYFDRMDRITPWKSYVCDDPPLDTRMNGGDRNNCHFRALTDIWD